GTRRESRQAALHGGFVEAGDAHELVAAAGAADHADGRTGDAERSGQQGADRRVRGAVDGRRRDAHAEGAVLPADDLVAGGPRLHAQRQQDALRPWRPCLHRTPTTSSGSSSRAWRGSSRLDGGEGAVTSGSRCGLRHARTYTLHTTI